MAIKACFLLLSLLAASNARPNLIKRQPANLVTDSSFDDASGSCLWQQDVTCGDWTVTGSAEIVSDTQTTNSASWFNGPPRDTGGTISQEIDGLTVGDAYTLSYTYRKYFNYKPTACSLSVTFGSQTIDSLQLSADTPGADHHAYKTRTKSFTPAQASGVLTLHVACPKSKGPYEVDLESVSIVSSA